MSDSPAPRVVVLFGPTAVGKTQLLFQTARSWKGPPLEVISADSMQVYRGFDCGTAKPTPRERNEIPHHLIDERDPCEAFDLGAFVRSCENLIGEISARGGLPVVSGGTAYYLRAFLCGMPRTPRADPAVREQLARRLAGEGLESLRAELARIDPLDEQRIGARDAYRVVRSLEVFYTTGKPRSGFDYPNAPRADLHPLVVGLRRDRAELHRRIALRVDQMFDQGLVAEVTRHMAAGIEATCPAAGAIGYREFYTRGAPPWSAEHLAAIRADIEQNTRRYAKRQMTFMAALPGVHWLDADDQAGFQSLLSTWIRG